MQDNTAPFRADHVGSFLRSPELKAARLKREAGEITAEQLKAIEDREIKALIVKQQEVGLKLATDGELRRKWWHYDFFFGSMASSAISSRTTLASTARSRSPMASASPAKSISRRIRFLSISSFCTQTAKPSPR